MKTARWKTLVIAAASLLILAVLLYQVPFIHNRLSWRIDDFKTRLVYTFNPPEEAVFVPVGIPSTATPDPQPRDPTPLPTVNPTLATPTPEPTTPLLSEDFSRPDRIMLENVVYVKQNERWNYCGPANLTMALNFWGWPGDRDDVARVVKPGVNNPNLDFIQRGRSDKNVMPSEMIDFVADETDLYIAARYGGDLELIKRFIASGYPVMVEKGTYREDYHGDLGWMGHYMFTTGYDDTTEEFIVQDSLIEKGNTEADHKNKKMAYQTYLEGWRSFNYLFMVIYPPDRQEEINQLLGPWLDPHWAYQHALKQAEAEIDRFNGINLFFAWFNKGTSLVKLERYQEAAETFDRAYQVYEQLAQSDAVRPYRITWYQTSPYMAYYYSGRYQDVINLANFTLETIADPTLEETLYWRGMAQYALGNTAQARDDLYRSVWLNPNFEAGLIQINQLGLE